MRILNLPVHLAGVAAVFLSNVGNTMEQERPNELKFTTKGIVRDISLDRHKAVIRHDAISNYMPAMTMEFNIRDTNELSGIATGDRISFRLTAAKDTHWVDLVRKIHQPMDNPVQPKPISHQSPRGELSTGDILPDSKLTAENGKIVQFSDFQGKVVALTFIFTRCPLPDFCPRMGNNFATARELLLAKPNAPTNWQFLSISFDPDFDKPSVLSRYAEFYRKGNTDRWLFAAAPVRSVSEMAARLDLMVFREANGAISHNLRTVVLDPRGRIHRQFNGNEWTPEELADAVLEAAGKTDPAGAK